MKRRSGPRARFSSATTAAAFSVVSRGRTAKTTIAQRGTSESHPSPILTCYSRDVRSFCCCLVMLAVLIALPSEPSSAQQPAASGAQEAQDVWRGLRWDMSIDRASQTLARQGLKVRKHG